MNVGNVIDRTVELMEDRLNFSSKNHDVIAANLANLDTPGYVSKKLTFDDSLKEAMKGDAMQLAVTSPRHLNPMDVTTEMKSPKMVDTGPVELESEMTRLAQNSLEYMYMTTLLNKKLSLLKQVIDDGGR